MLKSYYEAYQDALEAVKKFVSPDIMVIKGPYDRVRFQLDDKFVAEMHRHPAGGWVMLDPESPKVKVPADVFDGINAALKEGIIDRNMLVNMQYQRVKSWMMENDFGATATWMRTNYVAFKQGIFNGFEVEGVENA